MNEIDKSIIEVHAAMRGMDPDCYRLYMLVVMLWEGE